MSTLLEEGLDESYNRDPLWGSVKPHLMIAPAVLYDYKASVSNCAPGKAPKAGKAKKGSRGKAVKASKAAKASKASKASKGKANPQLVQTLVEKLMK